MIVLQSIITLVVNSLSIKILLVRILSSSTSSYQFFLCFEKYFTVVTQKLLWSSPYSIYLLLFLHHFFSCASPYISNIYIAYSAGVLGFWVSFCMSYSLNTLFTETNSSWLIHELIKDLEIVFHSVFPWQHYFTMFFPFFMMISLYFFILEAIVQGFRLTQQNSQCLRE